MSSQQDAFSIVVTLPSDVREHLQRLAQETHHSEAALVEEMVRSAVEEDKAFAGAVADGLRALDEGRSRPFAEFKADMLCKMAERRASK